MWVNMNMELQKKICLLGDFAVGKTSLIRRFVEGIFDEKYLSTLGAKVDRKVLKFEADEQSIQLKLLIWDIAGGEKFNMMMRSYYNGSSGAILVCDLTRLETILSLKNYVSDFHGINQAVPLVIMGNKVDLVEPQSDIVTRLAEVAAQYQVPYFVSSAKTGQNVEISFHTLGKSIVQRSSKNG